MPQSYRQQETLPEKLVPVGLIFLIDILLTCASFALSYIICANFFPGIVEHRLVIQMPIIIAITSLIFLSIGMYRGLVHYGRLRQVYSIFNAICLANILTIVFAVVNGKLILEDNLAIPLSIILVHSIISFVALGAARYLYKYLLQNVKEKFVKTSNVIVVHNFANDSDELVRFSNYLENRRKRIISQLRFSSEKQDDVLDFTFLDDNYVESFILLYKERPIPGFEEILEQLARFKRPIYFGHAPFKNNGVMDMNGLLLSRLDLVHLFAPRLNLNLSKRLRNNNVLTSTLLVTGAGGTIGREYVKTALNEGFNGKIVLLDNSESALNSIYNYCQTQKSLTVVSKLGDVKDKKFVERIFKEHRPEYVLHAAGNNKPEFVDDNISNIFKENVLATKTIADIASKYYIKQFVFCSSVEADQPASTLEVCKRLSEMYLSTLNSATQPLKFVSLRLNKVFDPDNSFINYLQWHIDLGRDVDITRFSAHKTFSNKKDVASALLYLFSDSSLPSSILASKLGLRIKTSILVDFMYSLGIKTDSSEKEYLNSTAFTKDSFYPVAGSNDTGLIKSTFKSPPLESVETASELSSDKIQKTIETICLNTVLNAQEFPEVFDLIQDFAPGYWKELHNKHKINRPIKDVIRLKQ